MNALWFLYLWMIDVKRREDEEEEANKSSDTIQIPVVRVSKFEDWLWKHPKLNVAFCIIAGCLLGLIPEILGKLLYWTACNWRK